MSQLVPLGDVADFVNGFAFKPNDWGEDGRKIIRIQNLTDSSKPYNRTTSQVNSKYEVHYGDLLVSWSATLGVFEWDDEEAAYLNQHIFKVVPDNRTIEKDYLRHALVKAIDDMNQYLRGSTMKHVNRGEFLGTKIPLPPLPEQRRIAAILDKADTIRRKRQQAIRLTEEFLRSVFLDMFGDPVTNPKGWEIVHMGEVLELITYGLTVRPNYIETGVPLISAKEIRDKFIDFESARKISVEDFSKVSEKGKPKKGDILFSKTGAIGHCAAVTCEIEFAITQNAARLVFDRERVNNCYAIQYLRTDFIQKLANREAKGNAVKDLQLGVMKKFPFFLPPQKQQEEFEQTIKKTRDLLNQQESFCRETEVLFNSLVQRAFRGGL